MSALFFGGQFVQFCFAENRHLQHLLQKQTNNHFQKIIVTHWEQKNYMHIQEISNQKQKVGATLIEIQNSINQKY